MAGKIDRFKRDPNGEEHPGGKVLSGLFGRIVFDPTGV
jgi:hypothetical protein